MIRTLIYNILSFEISSKQVKFSLSGYLLLYFVCLCSVIGLSHKLWTDEHHFLRAIEYFYHDTSLFSLKHYNELATPFTFLFYAWWAKLYVLEIEWLRMGSMLVAASCYLSIYTLSRLFLSRWLSFLCVVFVSLNPYMIGVSFFVYTDMWAIFTVVLAVYFIFTKQYVYASVALTIALWSRQYAVYQLTAICLFLIYKYFPNFKKMVGTCSIVSISFFSLIPLFLLWGGFTPVNQIRYVYIQSHIVYQWSGLWAYLSSLTVYTLPLLIVWLLYHNRSYALLVLSFLMASLYFWSPIQPSLCAVEASFESIGFFDKVLNKYISIKNIVEAIYFISISLQLYYLFHIAKSLKNQPINVFVILSIVMFLLIMPLSYIVWEKYILLLLPIYLLALVKNITTLKI